MPETLKRWLTTFDKSEFSPVRIAGVALRVTILFLAIVGIAEALNTALGDGPLPRFQALKQQAPYLSLTLMANEAHHLADGDATPSQCWEALQPSLQILQAISPEIAHWVVNLQQHGRIHYDLLPLQEVIFHERNIISSYNGNLGVLNLGNRFWGLSNGERVAYLVHEYRHSRQNRAKVLSALMTQVITGKLMEYGSELEDEAYLYQRDAYRALGIPPYSIMHYLHHRNLDHFEDL